MAKRKFTDEDLYFAYRYASDFMEMEEWPEPDGGAQEAAYKELARRFRRSADRIALRLARKDLT